MIKKISLIFAFIVFVFILDILCFYTKLYIINVDLKKRNLELFLPQYTILKSQYSNNVDDFIQHKKYQIYKSKNKNSDKNKKELLLLLGCSYAFGVQLPHDKRFPKHLSELLGMDIISFAFWGWGAHQMLWFSENRFLYDTIQTIYNTKPTYIIYVYMQDHVGRQILVRDPFLEVEPYLSYYDENGTLKLRKQNVLDKVLFRFFMYRCFIRDYQTKNVDNSYELLGKVILETKKNIEKQYHEIPFIMLAYIQNEVSIEEEEMFTYLFDNGVQVIKTSDLTKRDLSSREYVLPDGYHPNSSAWELISPIFVKNLN